MTYPLSAPPHQSDPPPRTQLLTNLTRQSHLLSTLFASLANPSPPSSSSPTHSINQLHFPSSPIDQIYPALQSLTAELDQIVGAVWTHQSVYAELGRRRSHVVGLEREVRALIRGLEEGRSELDLMVEEGRETLEGIERVDRDPLPVPSLLAHALSLARTTSAPTSALLLPHEKAQHQPWPTETAMRTGLLFQMQGSMSGVGDVGRIGDETKPVVPEVRETPVHHEEERRADREAVFQLDLNSDDSDGE